MTTEYLYRENKSNFFWNCIKGEAKGGGINRITQAHPLHELLNAAAKAQIDRYDSCRLVFFNKREEGGKGE